MKWEELKSEAKRIYWKTLREATERMGKEIKEKNTEKKAERKVKEESYDTPMPSDPDKVTARIKKRRREEIIQIDSSDSETEKLGDYGGHLARSVQHGRAKEESMPSKCSEIRRKKKRTATIEEEERNFELTVEEAKKKKSREETIEDPLVEDGPQDKKEEETCELLFHKIVEKAKTKKSLEEIIQEEEELEENELHQEGVESHGTIQEAECDQGMPKRNMKQLNCL